MSQRRPQVVAHRGSSETNAEHTLAAYLAAIDEGAEALECDVRLTADGHLVCVHDRNLRRTASSSGLVSTKSLDELDRLDFASWKSPWAELDDERPELDPALGKVLTLRRLLETVAAQDRRIELAIETKHPTRYGGLVEKRVVELLAEFGWAGADSPARVMSFSWSAVSRVQRLAPALQVVFLVDKMVSWSRAMPMRHRNWIAGPGIELVRKHPTLIGQIARTTPVHVWTVNTEEDIERCLALGVSALITDRPGFVLAYLRDREV